jgi:CheY-like chemotaxis protein
VHSDPVLLHRIVGNLLSNAVRYTERGGILIACRRQGGKTWLEVWDTGIGIPADKTSEIFEEFKQLDEGARTRGSGLGLAIVARTASLLGLTIRLRSRPQRGSLFAIELPPGRPLSAAPGIATTEVAQHSLRIALVEDNNALREALAFSLQDAGHEVTAAASGADLRARLGEAAPDVLLTDYRLPRGETGLDVINEMRTRHHELPAILLTGDTDPRLVREMAECGVSLLHKPVNLQTLLSYLDRLDLMSGVSRRRNLSLPA